VVVVVTDVVFMLVVTVFGAEVAVVAVVAVAVWAVMGAVVVASDCLVVVTDSGDLLQDTSTRESTIRQVTSTQRIRLLTDLLLFHHYYW
jgi:hypothetical protein